MMICGKLKNLNKTMEINFSLKVSRRIFFVVVVLNRQIFVVVVLYSLEDKNRDILFKKKRVLIWRDQGQFSAQKFKEFTSLLKTYLALKEN